MIDTGIWICILRHLGIIYFQYKSRERRLNGLCIMFISDKPAQYTLFCWAVTTSRTQPNYLDLIILYSYNQCHLKYCQLKLGFFRIQLCFSVPSSNCLPLYCLGIKVKFLLSFIFQALWRKSARLPTSWITTKQRKCLVLFFCQSSHVKTWL